MNEDTGCAIANIIAILAVLGFALIAMKNAGWINWAWWVVTIPLWLPITTVFMVDTWGSYK